MTTTATELLYVDTNILIYLLEKHEPYSTLVAEALEAHATGDNAFVTSTISVTEFLAGTTAANLATLRAIPRLHFVALDEALAEQAALLQRKTKGLQLGDAIHLAAALQQQAEQFFTNDKQLAGIAKAYIPVKTP